MEMGVGVRVGESKKMEEKEKEAGVHYSSSVSPLYFDPEF